MYAHNRYILFTIMSSENENSDEDIGLDLSYSSPEFEDNHKSGSEEVYPRIFHYHYDSFTERKACKPFSGSKAIYET